MRSELDELVGMFPEPRPQLAVRIRRRVEGGAVNAATHYLGPGRYEIRVTRRLVRDRPVGHLRAALAHETAHAHYGDPVPVRENTSLPACVLVFTGWVLAEAVVAAAAATLAHGLGATPKQTLGTGVGCFLVGFGLAVAMDMKLVDRADRRRGKDQWLAEARADLTAAHLTGRAAVHAQLRHLDLPGGGRLRRRAGTTRRVAEHIVADTHPPTPTRAALVADYDGIEDPDVAARRMCSERGLLNHRGWAPRWLRHEWSSPVPDLESEPAG